MHQAQRPTCVTVIGWTWIVIGSLMCMSAVMALVNAIVIGQLAQDASSEVPLIFSIFPLLVVIQLALGLLGLFAGMNFLKLKAWSRKILETLTWLLLVFLVGFLVFWTFHWVSLTSNGNLDGVAIMGVVMAFVITGVYATPLGFMLKYLRGSTVKDAIDRTNEAVHVSGDEA